MNVLIIDFGKKFLKLSLYSKPNQNSNAQTSLLWLSVKDIQDKNVNIISRVLSRELKLLSDENYTFDKCIVIPFRTNLIHKTFTLEYNSNPKIMQKTLTKEVNDSKLSESITDWTIQEDNPDNDFQNILFSTIDIDGFRNVCEIMKPLKLKQYTLTSNVDAFTNLVPKDGKHYLIINIGHLTTELVIIQNGTVKLVSENNEFGSSFITSALQRNLALSRQDLSTKQNNLYWDELKQEGLADELDILQVNIKKFYETWVEDTGQALAGYMCIGGIANMDLENLEVFQELPCHRIYPKLNLANDSYIPNSVRNYLYESVAVLENGDTGVNFLIPKDKHIGQSIKIIQHLFNIVKYPLIATICFGAFYLSSNTLLNKLLTSHLATQQGTVTNYQSQISTKKAEVDTLNTQYFEIYNDKGLKIVNYGLLLKRLGELAPNLIFISEIEDTTSKYVANTPSLTTPNTAPTTPTGDTSTGLLDTSTQTFPVATQDSSQTLETTQEDLLVVLEIRGYSMLRSEALSYALTLGQEYSNVKVLEIVGEKDDTDLPIYFFKIEIKINSSDIQSSETQPPSAEVIPSETGTDFEQRGFDSNGIETGLPTNPQTTPTTMEEPQNLESTFQ